MAICLQPVAVESWPPRQTNSRIPKTALSAQRSARVAAWCRRKASRPNGRRVGENHALRRSAAPCGCRRTPERTNLRRWASGNGRVGGSGHGFRYAVCSPSPRTFALGLPPDKPSWGCPCCRPVLILAHDASKSVLPQGTCTPKVRAHAGRKLGAQPDLLRRAVIWAIKA